MRSVQRYAIFKPARAAVPGLGIRSGTALGATATPARLTKGSIERAARAIAEPPSEPDKVSHVETEEEPDVPEGSVVAAAPLLPLRLIPQVAAAADGLPGEPWGVQAVGADTSEYSGATACVAVLDTGIDVCHPAFAGLKLDDDRYVDFTGTDTVDRSGHGTHVAGIIFGRDVDGKRIGVARGVTKVLIGKVADKDKLASTEQLEKALKWAIENGANIISMSVGIDFLAHVRDLQATSLPADAATSLALTDFRDFSYYFDLVMARTVSPGPAARSALVIAAAGNESHADADPPYRVSATLPATAKEVVSVGALARGGDRMRLAPFSNGRADICAPGVGILSAAPGGGLATMSGTSQAAPHVAGVAALWHHKLRKDGFVANASVLREKLYGSAQDVITPRPSYEDARRGLVRAP